jgi:putative transposase
MDERAFLVEVCKHREVTEAKDYWWSSEYGGVQSDDAKRLKELGKGNTWMNRLVIQRAPGINMLKPVNRGNFSAWLSTGQ